MKKGHSYRNYDPQEFLRLWDLADGGREEAKVREHLETVEAGRFYLMLKATHKFAVALDPDELETFWSRNPGLKEWVNVYATVEHQRTFD